MCFKTATPGGTAITARAPLVPNLSPPTFSALMSSHVNRLDDTNLYDAVHDSVEGRSDQPFAGDPEEGVLEVATGP